VWGVLYYKRGSEDDVLFEADLRSGLSEAFAKLGARRKVLAIPPDYTRVHSHAGVLTRLVWEYYGGKLTDILPALGTHAPMTENEIGKMFGNVPAGLFRVHDWRNDVVTLGEVPAEFLRQQSEGKVDYPWKAQVNKMIVNGGFDLVLSIGQVVPHEVIGRVQQECVCWNRRAGGH
jgi:nickel-dependent lactate racemase